MGETIAQVATAIAVAIASLQLWLGRRQSKTQFEQQFNDRYRSVVAAVPLDLMLGGAAEWADLDDQSRRAFYDYFELCEEEVFYREARRVNSATWREWCHGIDGNMQRPAFRAAWRHLSEAGPWAFQKFRDFLNEERGETSGELAVDDARQ